MRPIKLDGILTQNQLSPVAGPIKQMPTCGGHVTCPHTSKLLRKYDCIIYGFTVVSFVTITMCFVLSYCLPRAFINEPFNYKDCCGVPDILFVFHEKQYISINCKGIFVCLCMINNSVLCQHLTLHLHAFGRNLSL